MSDEPTPDVDPAAEPSLQEPTVFLKPIPVYEDTPDEADRFYVIGSDLYCLVDDLTIRLSLKIKQRLEAELEDKTPREQLYLVLRNQGNDQLVDVIEDLDIVDSREVVRKYWQAFGERNQARLGESLSSSPS